MQDPGDNPAVLYGYGGMGISMTPYFGSPETPFFDAGSIYAGANLRGDHYYTSSIHLAGEGDSNGGILNGRPDHPARKPLLAILSGIGVYDMLCLELELNGTVNSTKLALLRIPLN